MKCRVYLVRYNTWIYTCSYIGPGIYSLSVYIAYIYVYAVQHVNCLPCTHCGAGQAVWRRSAG